MPSFRSWFQRRHRRTLTWYGACFRRLPGLERAAVGLFCDCEGHHAGPAAGVHSDRGLDLLLGLLDRRRLRITFNVVAELCRTHPRRIRRIADAGHEIACHGWRHERPRDFDRAAVEELLNHAASCFAELGLRPVGFRSPQSDWSVPLLRALATLGYRWNAERDPADTPYRIMGGLIRLPVATDDWDLVADPAALPRLMFKWRQCVDRGLARRRVVCIGLHEWLLGAHLSYAAALGGFLSGIGDGSPLILPLGELALSS